MTDNPIIHIKTREPTRGEITDAAMCLWEQIIASPEADFCDNHRIAKQWIMQCAAQEIREEIASHWARKCSIGFQIWQEAQFQKGRLVFSFDYDFCPWFFKTCINAETFGSMNVVEDYQIRCLSA